MPAIGDRALIRAGVVTVKVLVQLIATLREGIHELDEEIEQTAAGHPTSQSSILSRHRASFGPAVAGWL
ncbi:MAG TPA: hypothetical protein VEW69_10550 [Alphaproteobacteria bacterium]|nr:hypothetical protein [Alphaproteobacteria bacterium]